MYNNKYIEQLFKDKQQLFNELSVRGEEVKGEDTFTDMLQKIDAIKPRSSSTHVVPSPYSTTTIQPPKNREALKKVSVGKITSYDIPDIDAKIIKRGYKILDTIGTYGPTSQFKNASTSKEGETIYSDKDEVNIDKNIELLNGVHLAGVTSAIDTNIIADNIKQDVNILNVIGSTQGDLRLSEEEVITPEANSERIIESSDDYEATKQYKVKAVDSTISSNIIPENIKKGVNILGVAGTYELLPGQSLTKDPNMERQTFAPDKDHSFINAFTLNKISSSMIPAIDPRDIRVGIDILGTTGTLLPLATRETVLTPSLIEQEVLVEEPNTGFSKIVINPMDKSLDSNAVASNIRVGRKILGVEGGYSGQEELKLEEKVVIPTTSPQIIRASDNYDALSKVTIQAVPAQEVICTPSQEVQEITGDTLYSKVTVEKIDSRVDKNIKPENIKKNITILNTVGTSDGIDPGSFDGVSGGNYDIGSKLVDHILSIPDGIKPKTFYVLFGGLKKITKLPTLDPEYKDILKNPGDMHYAFTDLQSLESLGEYENIDWSKATYAVDVFKGSRVITSKPLDMHFPQDLTCGGMFSQSTLNHYPNISFPSTQEYFYLNYRYSRYDGRYNGGLFDKSTKFLCPPPEEVVFDWTTQYPHAKHMSGLLTCGLSFKKVVFNLGSDLVPEMTTIGGFLQSGNDVTFNIHPSSQLTYEDEPSQHGCAGLIGDFDYGTTRKMPPELTRGTIRINGKTNLPVFGDYMHADYPAPFTKDYPHIFYNSDQEHVYNILGDYKNYVGNTEIYGYDWAMYADPDLVPSRVVYNLLGVQEVSYIGINNDQEAYVNKKKMIDTLEVNISDKCSTLDFDLGSEGSTSSYDNPLYTKNIVSTNEFNAIEGGGLTGIPNLARYCNLHTFNGFHDLGKSFTQNTGNYRKFDLRKSENTLTKESVSNIVKNLYDLNLTYDVANGDTFYRQQVLLGKAALKLTPEEIAEASRKGWDIPLPPPPAPVSFSTDSWATIQKAVKDGNTSKYHVGDTKEVAIAGYTNTPKKPTFTVRIANMSTPTECSQEGFSQTACGFVVEFVDIITKYNMNTNLTNVGGWPASDMYKLLNNETNSIYSVLPSDLQKVIIDTYTVSGHGSTSGETNFTSNDKLYLLSTREVYGKEGTSSSNIDDTADKDSDTRQLDYYKGKKVTTASPSEAIKKYQGSAALWWLRSARSNYDFYFFVVNTSGGWNGIYATGTFGVAPAFRIG